MALALNPRDRRAPNRRLPDRYRSVIRALFGRGDARTIVGAGGLEGIRQFGKVDVVDAHADQAQGHAVQEAARLGDGDKIALDEAGEVFGMRQVNLATAEGG